MMRRMLLSGVAAMSTLLPIVIASAADTPEIVQRKQELMQAYQISHSQGICAVFGALRSWQASDWPDGEAAVTQFLNEEVLPRFIQDPAALKDKTAAEIEAEFGRFCSQAQAAVTQLLDKLAQVPEAEAEQAGQLRATFLAATFLGQCQATSALYLQGVPEHKNQLEKFVVARIYASDAKYRHEEIDLAGVAVDVGAAAEKMVVNQEKEQSYWRDCDTAEARFKEIFEQLKPVT